MSHNDSHSPQSAQKNAITSRVFCWWRWILGGFFVLLLALWGVGEFMLNTALHPTPSVYRDSLATLKRMYHNYPHIQPWYDSLQTHHALHDTTIVAADGAKLHGYYIRAAMPTKRVAVLVHGYQDAALRMLHIAYLYHHDLGANVLMPDLRYHGKTAGESIGMGWNDRLDVRQWAWTASSIFANVLQKDTSAQVAAKESSRNTMVNAPHLVVHGISMGAATTMMLSGADSLPPICAYVEDCGYTSAWDIFKSELRKRYHLPAFPVLYASNALCKWHYGWSFREADAEKSVSRCRQPMLFIHGDQDKFVPTAMVYRVYAAKPQPKSLWIAPQAEHAASYLKHRNKYTQRVADFLAPYW